MTSKDIINKKIKGGNIVVSFILSYIVLPLMLLLMIYAAYKYFLPDGFSSLIPSILGLGSLIPSIPGLGSILGDGGLFNPLNEDPGVFISDEDLKKKKYNYIFGTINEKGKKYYYPVPDDGKIWYNPAMGIRTPDIFDSALGTNKQDGLNYDGGENNPHEDPKYYGIEFQDNRNSIFKFSPDGDANNSKGLEGENNASAVFNLEAPAGYIPEPSILYREQSGKDYVYRVFRKDSFTPPKPNYIMQTINNKGKINTYVIPDEKMWVLPKKGIITDEVKTLNFSGGTANEGNKKEHYGVEFKKDSKIFVNTSNKNNPNSWGCCSGKNNCNAVYALSAPAGYTKETKFLYRNQNGPDYCYSVFKLNTFDESIIKLDFVDIPGTLLNCPSYGEIKSKNKCLDLPEGKTDNGINPQLWDCNNSIAQQFYYDTKTSSIRTVSDFNKCLDIPNGDAVINKKVQVWDCNDSKPQKFNYILDKTLFNSALDNNLCLDSSNGSSIILNTCNDSEEQKFKMNQTFNTGLTCTIDSRVADCPPGYTNNGLTCGRGVSSETLDFGKGKYITANCPKGTTNTGGSCLGSFGRGGGWAMINGGIGRCENGTDNISDKPGVGNCEAWGAYYYPKCSYLAKKKGYDNPDNWTNDGCCMCSPSIRDINKVGKCPDPVYKEQSAGLCYVNCQEKYGEGYYNNGSNCRREASTKGLDSMVCNNPGEHVSAGRCYKKQPPNFTNMGTFMSFNR